MGDPTPIVGPAASTQPIKGLRHNVVKATAFNPSAHLPYALRLLDFQIAMQDVYDYFFDVNTLLIGKGLKRLDDMLRQAIMSGMLSDMLTASIAKHSRTLTENRHHNGHPDLVVEGRYPDNDVLAGSDGVEIKTTLKPGGAVDFHGPRDQWLCVFVYDVDKNPHETAAAREPLTFREVYVGQVTLADFRHNARLTDLGTRTATLDREGVRRFRENWVYRDRP